MQSGALLAIAKTIAHFTGGCHGTCFERLVRFRSKFCRNPLEILLCNKTQKITIQFYLLICMEFKIITT